MVQWQSLIKFDAEDGAEYWASIPLDTSPTLGLAVKGYSSIASLESDGKSTEVKVKNVAHPIHQSSVITSRPFADFSGPE